MNLKRQKIMRKSFMIVAAVAAMSFLMAGNRAVAQDNMKYVEVTAKVDKQVVPDELMLNVTVYEKDLKKPQTLESVEKGMIKVVTDLGLNPKEVMTIDDMGAALRRKFLKKDEVQERRSYTLKLSNANQLAICMDSFGRMGIYDMNLGQMKVSTELEKQTKDELLAAAARQAKENADVLTGALDAKTGKPIYIQSYYNIAQGGYQPRYMLKSMAMMDSAEGANAVQGTELDVDKVSVSISVTCRFEIDTK